MKQNDYASVRSAKVSAFQRAPSQVSTRPAGEIIDARIEPRFVDRAALPGRAQQHALASPWSKLERDRVTTIHLYVPDPLPHYPPTQPRPVILPSHATWSPDHVLAGSHVLSLDHAVVPARFAGLVPVVATSWRQLPKSRAFRA